MSITMKITFLKLKARIPPKHVSLIEKKRRR